MQLIVLGNSSADMDSIVSAYVLSKAQNGIPCINIPNHELSLRRDVLYLFSQACIDLKEFCFVEDLSRKESRIILVDHNTIQSPWMIPYVEGIIDHHADENCPFPHLKEKQIEKVGSCATLIAERLFSTDKMTNAFAYLLLAPILLDTSNLTDLRKVTTRDIEAVNNLKKFSAGPSYLALLEKRLDVHGFSPTDLLRRDFKDYGKYGIASLPKGVEWNIHNRHIWENALVAFANRKVLFVLEWVGEDKAILLYTPDEAIKRSILASPFFVSSKELGSTTFLMLDDPFARKELQPLLQEIFCSFG